MSSTQPRATGQQIPEGADDFSKIERITLPIARRLYNAGILTFTDLAELTPDEIVRRTGSKAGISAARIAKEDWSGQAQRLAAPASPAPESVAQKALATKPVAETPLAEPGSQGVVATKSRPEEPANHEHLAVFTVRLHLDANDEVLETHVAYDRTKGSGIIRRHWDGWDAERLLRFVRQIVYEHHSVKQPPAAPGETSHHIPPPAPPTKTDLEQMTRELAFVSAPEGEPLRILDQGRPGNARLALDLALRPAAVARPDSYAVIFRAKRVGSRDRFTLGEARGKVPKDEHLVVTANTRSLPPGLYRLEALVALDTPTGSWPGPTEPPLQGELVLVG